TIPYLVMDHAPHGSLSTRHPRQSPLELKTVLSYAKQIALALQFAHEHQVVHCDVKPANMLLGYQDTVLLSDFGIAIVLQGNLKTHEVAGTMHYMAPEQFIGKPVPASDQYSLGVVIYQWLCGQFPFYGKNYFEMHHLHTHVPPPSLRKIQPHIPGDVEQVVLTALAKNPLHRFASVQAFVTALEQAIHSQRFILPTANESVISHSAPTVADPQAPTIPNGGEPEVLLPSLSSLLPPVSPQRLAGQAPLHLPASSVSSPDKTTYRSPPTIDPPPVPGISPEQPALSSIREAAPSLPLAANAPATPLQEPYMVEDVIGPGLAPLIPRAVEIALPDSEPEILIYSNHTSWVSAVAWSPNGKLIASGSWDTMVQIWDAASGGTIRTYEGHEQPVKSIAWSPDGTYMASGSWDNTVQIWETNTGTILPDEYHHEAQVETVAWSPDGRYIASAGHDGIVHIWRPFNKRTVLSYRGHSGPVWKVDWSPDGKYIASASHDRSVQVWEALTGIHILTYYQHQYQVATVAWSPDGQLLASGDHDGMVHLWESATGNMRLHYRDEAGAVKALCWSPTIGDTHGLRLASAVKQVQIWNITKTLPSAPNLTYAHHTNWINALAWSPDGQAIASASDDKTIQVWDAS
ncbi:MAG: protein kinase, partial [Ktedonobacteraceae bacterium]|nr:protein kinase [Ktedonobacteraceae bacterium]